MKFIEEIASQISEHCLKNIPERLRKKLIWLRRPGVASILILEEGSELRLIRKLSFKFGRRMEEICISVLTNGNKKIDDFIYESNSIFLKSWYS